jgi:hypothetical protein
VFAGGLTLTDPAHQTQLERQRIRRRQRHQVEVEIRPLVPLRRSDSGMTNTPSSRTYSEP